MVLSVSLSSANANQKAKIVLSQPYKHCGLVRHTYTHTLHTLIPQLDSCVKEMTLVILFDTCTHMRRDFDFYKIERKLNDIMSTSQCLIVCNISRASACFFFCPLHHLVV